MSKKETNEVRITASGISIIKFNKNLVKKGLKEMQSNLEIEVHPDGAKEVKREACRFCRPGPPCENEWCPTNEEE